MFKPIIKPINTPNPYKIGIMIVRNDIYDDVTDKLAVFPRAITDDIDLSRYDIWADAGEIESYVCDVLADPGDRDYGDFYDEDRSYSGYLDGMDELDFIFAE